MKANELMINDLVKCGKRLVRISNILSHSASGIELIALDPIPLTEEMLRANGAYDDEDGRSITIDCHYVGAKDVVSLCEYKGGFEISVLTCVDMTGEPNEVYDLPPVKYVHELQHAFRLCGLNELADNFVI